MKGKQWRIGRSAAIICIMSLLLIIGLCGCSSDDKKTAEISETQEELPANRETTAEVPVPTETEVPIVESTQQSEDDVQRITISILEKDMIHHPVKEIENTFADLGFCNIETIPMEWEEGLSAENHEDVIDVQINGVPFSAGESYSPEDKVTIAYLNDTRLTVPQSSLLCEGMQYDAVEKLFRDAGFTNIRTAYAEVPYNEKVESGSVIIVSINDEPIFGADAKYPADTEIGIFYRVMLPQESETASPTEKPPKETETDSGNTEAYVWIPTNGGTKYHRNAGCSKMESPVQVTLSEAQSRGFTACKRCY